MKKSRLMYKLILILFVFLQGVQVFLYTVPKLRSQEVSSGNLTTATDTLSNSRLSFYGKIAAATNANTNLFTLTASAPDVNNAHLFPRDTVLIGSNNSQTVATIAGSLQFGTTTNSTNQLSANDPVYATQSATHTVTFTTVSTGNIQGGAIRILIPAGDNTSASSNSLPDGGTTDGFDFASMAASDVTCPTAGGVTWATATATSSATFGNRQHAFECQFYGGTLAAGAYTMTIGGTHKLINPAPRTIHTQGAADTYIVRIQQLDYISGYAPVDTVNTTVSPVEAVLVSATVNPSLTFSIAGLAAGTYCGVAAQATTATTVSYGELNGSDTFYNAAQLISIATNATSGYTIKLAEDDDLKKPGTSTYIAVGTCDQGGIACAATTVGSWITAANHYGWGYSLESVSGSPTLAFTYTSGSAQGNCLGSTAYCAKAFACNNVSGSCAATTAEQTIASSTVPVSTQTFRTCYRLNYGPTQATGYYQTRLLYYALATF